MIVEIVSLINQGNKIFELESQPLYKKVRGKKNTSLPLFSD